MTDLLDTPAGEFEWGPRRRFEAARKGVSQATLRDRLPEIATAVGATILVGGAILLWLSFGSSDAAAAPQEPPPAAVVQPAAAPFPTAEPEPLVIVHVSGLVAQPGIVEIPTSARVFQAVEAAGGSLENADLDSINLAAPVVDGSQIHVPAKPVAETVETVPETELESPGQPAANGAPEAVGPDVDAAVENETSTAPTSGAQTVPASPSPDGATPAVEPSPAARQTQADVALETPVDPWGPEQPNPIPPEVEELMLDRETAPTADEIDALLAEAGLGETGS